MMRQTTKWMLGCLLAVGAVAASAQAWPAKPITIVVAYPAGGDTDALARVFAEKLQTRLGQPVLVDNKPGASGVIGSSFVGKAAPDGYTLLMAPSTFTMAQLVLKTAPSAGYDVRAFTPSEFDRIEQAAAAIAARPGIAGTTVTSALQRNFPPWPRSASTEALVARANRLYAELGRQLTMIEVGSSSDVNYAAEAGAPALDAFGVEGDGAHSPADYADFATFVPRAYLLARLIMDAGRDPPVRP